MNADGSAGVNVSATVGVRAGFLLPLALLLMGLGLIVTGIAVALIIRGASSGGTSAPPQPPGAPLANAPLDAALAGAPLAASASVDSWQPHPRAVSPVSLNARLDEPLSRWLWLVKWFLAIPHFIVLGFLWIAFFVVGRLRVLRDPLHGALSAWPLRLQPRCAALVVAGVLLLLQRWHRHRPLPTVQPRRGA